MRHCHFPCFRLTAKSTLLLNKISYITQHLYKLLYCHYWQQCHSLIRFVGLYTKPLSLEHEGKRSRSSCTLFKTKLSLPARRSFHSLCLSLHSTQPENKLRQSEERGYPTKGAIFWFSSETHFKNEKDINATAHFSVFGEVVARQIQRAHCSFPIRFQSLSQCKGSLVLHPTQPNPTHLPHPQSYFMTNPSNCTSLPLTLAKDAIKQSYPNRHSQPNKANCASYQIVATQSKRWSNP